MDVLVMVGTMKGLFLFRSDESRGHFEINGPFMTGKEVYSAAYDASTGLMLAGASTLHWGASIHRSEDLGESWIEPDEVNIKFPEGSDWALQRVWQLTPMGDGKTVLAGTEPAALFRSEDGGLTFSLEKGLYDHPHRTSWQPGGGGLCLHTIVVDPSDPSRLYVAISTGGVYRSTDAGGSWHAANKGVRAEFLPEKFPEFGQCVHKIAISPAKPKTIFLQNHWGLYRSDDGADSWQDVANGIPSDFGFPIVAHPHEPDTAYVIPLDSDRFRATVDGACRVFKTKDAGASWQPLTDGLPQEDAYLTVLRDGFTNDTLEPAGLYFGTRNGDLYVSADTGQAWNQVAANLPPVVCVRAYAI